MIKKIAMSEITNIPMIGVEEYKIIYNCLNGKGSSCISGREIGKDSIRCALNKAFRNHSSTIVAKFKEMEMDENASEKKEKTIRDELSKKLAEKIFLNEQKPSGLEAFFPGAKVKIKKDSEYADQNSGRGTVGEDIARIKDTHTYFEVIFDDGYKNSYRVQDLNIMDKKSENKGKNMKKKIEEIVKKTEKGSNRDEFIEKISEEISKHIEINEEMLGILFRKEGIDGFAKGDDIIMNKKANDHYNLTKEGSIGKVLSISGRDINVKFSYLTGGGDSGDVWPIAAEFMENRNPKIPKKVTPKNIQERIKQIAIEMIDEIEKEYMRNKIEGDSEKYRNKYETIGIQKLIEEKLFLPIGNGQYALNFSDVTKFVAPELYKMYTNPGVFTSPTSSCPPAERQPNVLQLELTNGCNHNGCTYCNLYNTTKSCTKTIEEFKGHVDKVLKSLGDHRDEITRVFIGSGNALSADQDILRKAVRYVDNKLDPKRISTYGNTGSFLDKGKRNLRELRDNGLGLVYRGAETGSNEVLKYVNKGHTTEDMLKAGEMANEAYIDLSVMLMPGLGGRRFSEEHIQGIIKLLDSVEFKFITLMAINPPEDSRYTRIMEKEFAAGTNRPLNNVEIVEQIRDIVKHIRPRGQKIGMFGEEIDVVGANPINFRVTLDTEGKREIITLCNNYIRKNK